MSERNKRVALARRLEEQIRERLQGARHISAPPRITELALLYEMYVEAENRAAKQGRDQHYGRLDSFPPYVGGDEDEIDEWQAECQCGWRGRKTKHVSVAYGELVKHLNDCLLADPLAPPKAEA